MATFVLVHGSFHAAWNWHKVIPLLEALGHRGVALDLPGHGKKRGATRDAPLDACVQAVIDAIDREPGPVVLVAHSRSGVVISQAAEARPERLQGLVYLAAYLVPSGRSMMDYAVLDPDSLVVQNVTPAFDRARALALLRIARTPLGRWALATLLPRALRTHVLDPEAYRDALYHDCPAEIVALARALLEPEPTLAGFTPLRLTARRYGRIPKVYVECTLDRAVTLALQRRMQADSPCDRVVTLSTGHSPFFSRPEALVRALVESLATFGATPPSRLAGPPRARVDDGRTIHPRE